MHIAIRPTSITSENKNGGLCNRRIAKSATNKLVKNGWSIKALRIFLNVLVLSVMAARS